MFKRMARFSRIVACGAISGYNSTEVVDLSNIFEVISMRIRMQVRSYLFFSSSLTPVLTTACFVGLHCVGLPPGLPRVRRRHQEGD